MNLVERLDQGPVLCAEGYLFEMEKRGYLQAGASVFTSSNKTAHVAARKIKAGTVAVNCYGEGDVTTPFGGYKLSGFGGRDKSLAAHDQYCELKTIWIDLK